MRDKPDLAQTFAIRSITSNLGLELTLMPDEHV